MYKSKDGQGSERIIVKGNAGAIVELCCGIMIEGLTLLGMLLGSFIDCVKSRRNGRRVFGIVGGRKWLEKVVLCVALILFLEKG